MSTMTRSDLEALVAAARAAGEQPDLSHADLSDMHLKKANLKGANLTDADLIDANLTGTDLTDTNLTNANLSGANLPPSALTLSTVTDEQWKSAKLGPTQVTRELLIVMRDAITTTDPTDLGAYAQRAEIGVRMAVGSNTHTSPDVLLRLAADSSHDVRHTILDNSAASPEARAAVALHQ